MVPGRHFEVACEPKWLRIVVVVVVVVVAVLGAEPNTSTMADGGSSTGNIHTTLHMHFPLPMQLVFQTHQQHPICPSVHLYTGTLLNQARCKS
jgi:hypothetical protein